MAEQCAGGVWVNPKDPFDKVLIVSSDAVLFANPDAEKIGPALEALSQGRSDAAAMLGKAKGTPLSKLKKVSCNLKKGDVHFHWGTGKESTSKSFSPTSREQRDQLLAAVASCLGAGWVRKDTQFTALRAAVAPIVWMIVVFGITAVIFMAALDREGVSEVEIHGRRALLKRLFVWAVDLLGTTGSLIAGGAIVALLLVWLVVRAKDPPFMAVIEPR